MSVGLRGGQQPRLECGVNEDRQVAWLPLMSVSFFDPASRAASVQQMAFGMEGIHITERFLVDLYRKHLPVVRAAAAAAR